MDIDQTQAQLEVAHGFAEGQRIWRDILKDMDTARLARIEELKGRRKRRGVFDFLNLPAELRNKIYELCIALDDEEHEDKCQCELPQEKRKKPRNTKQRREKEDLAQKLNTIRLDSISAVEQMYTSKQITEQAYTAFKIRAGQNQQDRTFITADMHARRDSISVLGNGALARKLPPICCLNAQTFQETFGLFFPCNKTHVHASKQDIFPAFRLFSMLRRCNIIVQGPAIQLLPADAWWLSDSESNQRAKYARLITLHWFHNLPLWDCLTGVRSNDISIKYNLFGRWMYSVRQIVALFHEGFTHWDSLSRQCWRIVI